MLVALSMAVLSPVSVAWGQSTAQSAAVTVLHGLPNFTADVYVNGKLTLSGFKAETATEPLQLAPGSYELQIRNVGAAADSKPVLQASVRLKPGQNISIIAGLTAGGDPKLNLFVNDQTNVPAGKARLVIRNVAEAPALRVALDGKTVFAGVGNSTEDTTRVEAGRHSLQIAPASGGQPLDSRTVDLREGTAEIIYPVGSAAQGTFGLMVQTITGLQSNPRGVTSGTGGAAAPAGFPVWAAVLMAMAVAGAAASGAVLVRSRQGS